LLEQITKQEQRLLLSCIGKLEEIFVLNGSQDNIASCCQLNGVSFAQFLITITSGLKIWLRNGEKG